MLKNEIAAQGRDDSLISNIGLAYIEQLFLLCHLHNLCQRYGVGGCRYFTFVGVIHF